MDRISIMKSVVSNIKKGIFVEIGTFSGDFAFEILSNSSDDCILYCIDPWIEYNDYNDAANYHVGDALFQITKNKLKQFGDRVIFIREFASNAVNLIPDNIDFLYIDGNHQYKYVYQDLELYYPKVKQDGIIIGDDAHDFDDSKRNADGDIYIEHCPGSFGHYGVIKAFKDYVRNNNLPNYSLVGTQIVINKNNV